MKTFLPSITNFECNWDVVLLKHISDKVDLTAISIILNKLGRQQLIFYSRKRHSANLNIILMLSVCCRLKGQWQYIEMKYHWNLTESLTLCDARKQLFLFIFKVKLKVRSESYMTYHLCSFIYIVNRHWQTICV